MKKLFYFLLPVIFLSSCSPAFGGGGFLIPLGALLLCVWSLGRFKFGWSINLKDIKKGFFQDEKVTGSRFAFIAGLVMAGLALISFISMSLSK